MALAEDIVCFEIGSDQPPWTGVVADLGKDMHGLECLFRDGVVILRRHEDTIHVTGNDRVGLVILPSGRRLVIRSKIDSLVVLDWLSYLGEFPSLEAWLAESGVTTGEEVHVCLARLFLHELDRVTRHHLRKDYAHVAREESVVRGRIQVGRLCQRLHRLPLIPLRYRSRTLDTKYNMVLALALDRLPILLKDSPKELCRKLGELRELWSHVKRQMYDPLLIATESQWACPPGYRIALQLARLVLMGTALDVRSPMGGQAFTLSLALIWERGLRRMFDHIANQTGWKCLPDSARTRSWDDSVGSTDPARWLTADLIGECKNRRWVLDAKYKRAFGNESRGDRFQICAYAIAFNADRVSLVYPTSTTASGTVRRLLATVYGQKQLVVDSIELPMSAGPKACMAALKDVWPPPLLSGY